MRRAITLGGLDKSELLRRLAAAPVLLNELAHTLFADPRFLTSPTPVSVHTVELSAVELGLPAGGTFARVVQSAAALGLELCPLELGPHLRLQLLDQPEGSRGQTATPHTAPPGAITVASHPISEDENTPCGFYLRRIEGALWLRAYRSWPGHVWSGTDRFVFVEPCNYRKAF